MYEMQKSNLELQLKTPANQLISSDISKLVDSYSGKIKGYETDKDSISAQAKRFEAERDSSRSHSERFCMAVIFLQVSILLSSISALAKRKTVWYLSMAIGVVGIAYF